MSILVLCTGNSARSILLEMILTHRSGGRVRAKSAGARAAGKVHPQSLLLLAEKGFPTDGLTSQSWDDYAKPDAPVMDAVITVCGSAAAKPVRQPAAFAQAYALLSAKAATFLAEPFEDMTQPELQTALNKAGA